MVNAIFWTILIVVGCAAAFGPALLEIYTLISARVSRKDSR